MTQEELQKIAIKHLAGVDGSRYAAGFKDALKAVLAYCEEKAKQ